MDNKSLSKLVQTMPSVLSKSIDDDLGSKLTWLKGRLELDDEGVSKLVKRLPQVLSYSIEENLKPKLAWLEKRLELDDEGICKLVQSNPSVHAIVFVIGRSRFQEFGIK